MGAENSSAGSILNLANIDAIAREILRIIDGEDVREAGAALSICIAAIGFHAGGDRSRVLLATVREIENTWLKLEAIKAQKNGQETPKIGRR